MTVTEAERNVLPYDFQRRDSLERSRLRRLQPILEVMAHRMSGSLTSILRKPVKIEIGDLEQHRWDEYANALPEPTFLTSTTVSPVGGRIVLHLPLPLAMAIVDLRLGGSGRGDGPERSLTQIEHRLVSDVATGALSELPPSFAPVIALSLGAMTAVASGMFLAAAQPGEMCLQLGLKVELTEGDVRDASLCVPLAVLLPILDALERLDFAGESEESPAVSAALRTRLLDVDVDVSVHWPDVGLSPDELLNLAAGDVIPLRCSGESPLILGVDGTTFCSVVPTSRGKRLACYVVEPPTEEHR